MKLQIINSDIYFNWNELISIQDRKKHSLLHRLLIPFLAICLFMVKPGFAQDRSSDIEKIFSWARPNSPGCVCAVSKDGEMIFNRAYGSADLEREVTLHPNSVFDAGSLRKQFVATAVLLLLEDGKLSLTDEVRKHVPELPEYGHKITIDHLLTHTSGIRDWQPLLNLAEGDPDAMTMILRQRGLNFVPGEEWAYSNSGYVLLTEIIARVSGMPFPEFAQKRLFEPLGMKSTTYVIDMTQLVKNRALAYGKNKDLWKLDMYLGNDRGSAGALLTTASDLLQWNDALTNNLLGSFVSQKLEENAKLNNGRILYYTRGLTVEPYRNQKMVSHSGGVAGYHSWLGRLPEQKLSIAVLCNSDAMAATAIAHRIIAMYQSSKSETDQEDGPPPTIPTDMLSDVNRKAGLFINTSSGETMQLIVQGGRFRIARGPGLVPSGKERFRRWGAFVEYKSQDRFEITFTSPDTFEYKSMEGEMSTFSRVQAYSPSARELDAFTGQYRSEELIAKFDIDKSKAGLLVGVNDKPGAPFTMTPIHPDTFQFAGVILHFIRNKSGEVVGLDYSNPVLRKVVFTKIGN